MELDKKYRRYIHDLNEEMRRYYKVLDKAFSPNYEEALEGSVALAISFGVPGEELLKSFSEIDDYFMA